jgi:glycosyltransferase involved in cell wall biosynthesis
MLSYTSDVTIALDATPLTVSTGGVPRYTLELATALAKTFPEDRYWLLTDQPISLSADLPPNLSMGAGPHTAAGRRWWLWGLRQEMSRRGVDLFHGTDYSVPYTRSHPSVLTLHDLSPWLDPAWQRGAGRVRRRTPRLLRWGFATMVITPSEAVRRAAIDRFHLDPDRVVAVPLAANTQFRPCPARLQGLAAPYFLFVGTLEPRKNIARLIEAWRCVRRQCSVDLVLAGRVREDFPAPPEEPGLHRLGMVPEADLPKLYSGALACVYPSLYEGFGLPVLEAMQCGALVITSRDAAITEVTCGTAAVHVDAADTSALADAMLALARRPEAFADIRTQALGRSKEFTWQRTAERTREVYDAARRAFRN